MTQVCRAYSETSPVGPELCSGCAMNLLPAAVQPLWWGVQTAALLLPDLAPVLQFVPTFHALLCKHSPSSFCSWISGR